MDYRYYQPDITQKLNNQSEPTQKPSNQSEKSINNRSTHNQSGIRVIEFDSSVGKTQKASPPKERPSFGHRHLTGTNSKKTTEEFVVGKTVRPTSAKVSQPSKTRPASGKTYMAPINSSSIGAYIQLKKAGKLNTSTRPGNNGKCCTSAFIEVLHFLVDEEPYLLPILKMMIFISP